MCTSAIFDSIIYHYLNKQIAPPPPSHRYLSYHRYTFPPVLLLSNQIILALHIIVLPSYCLIFDQPTKTCFPQLGKCMEKGNIGKRLLPLETCGLKHFKVTWCLNFEGVLNNYVCTNISNPGKSSKIIPECTDWYQVDLAKNTLTQSTLEIWKLLVIAFRKYMTSHGLRTLCNGP